MSEIEGVSFNEEQELVERRVLPPEKPKLSFVRIVMSTGLAKTEEGANTTLACFAVVLIVAAAGTYLWSTVPRADPQTVAAENDHLQQLQARATQ